MVIVHELSVKSLMTVEPDLTCVFIHIIYICAHRCSCVYVCVIVCSAKVKPYYIHFFGILLFSCTNCCWEPLKVSVKVKVISRVRLCYPMDCSLPGSSIHGIFQARVLEWVAISFSRGSSPPRDGTRVSCITGRHFMSKGLCF